MTQGKKKKKGVNKKERNASQKFFSVSISFVKATTNNNSRTAKGTTMHCTKKPQTQSPDNSNDFNATSESLASDKSESENLQNALSRTSRPQATMRTKRS